MVGGLYKQYQCIRKDTLIFRVLRICSITIYVVNLFDVQKFIHIQIPELV